MVSFGLVWDQAVLTSGATAAAAATLPVLFRKLRRFTGFMRESSTFEILKNNQGGRWALYTHRPEDHS